MAGFKVIVHGATELEKAFADVRVKIDPDVGKVLSAAGRRVRDSAQKFAVANITNIGPSWSRMKSGRRGTMVYVAGAQHAQGGSARPNLSPLLFNQALLPAVRENDEQTVAAVDAALELLFARGGVEVVAGIFVEIVGNATQFKRELESAVASTAKANSGFRKMGRAAGVAGLALGGALVVGLAHAAKGALEDETANARLAKSFQNAHQPISEFKKRIDDATKSGINLGFHDEKVASSLASLVTATHSGTSGLKLLASAEDIARFKVTDLDSASKLLTSTMSGNVRSAKALGIQLIPVTTNIEALRAKYKALGQAIPAAELLTAKYADKQATAELAVRKLNAAIGGQAEAYAKTGQGQIDVLNAKTDHLSDSLGKHLVPAIKAAVDGLNTFVEFMSEHETLTVAFTIALGALATSLLAVSAAAFIADAALSPILIPVAAAVVAIGVLSFVAYKLVTDFKNSWPLLLPIVLGPLGAIIAAVIHWHSQIAGAFTAAWNTVKTITTGGINAVLGAIRGAIATAEAAASSVGRAIVAGLKSGLAAIVGAVTGAFSRVWGFIRGLVGTAGSVGREIGSAIMHGIASGIASAVGSAISAAKGAVGGVLNSVKSFAHIRSPSMLFAHEVGEPISEGIALGITRGQAKMHSALIHGIATAKAGADDWIDSTGVDNMTDKGAVLARSLAGGFQAALSGAALVNAPGGNTVGSIATGLAANGMSGAALVNSPLGALNSSPTVIHNVLTLDGKVIYDDWKKQAQRDVNRNGGTGVRS